MHELGIANSVLEAVRTEAARRPGCRPSKVGVKIGELAAVDPESLRFCFEALVKQTELEPLALDIEFCPRRQYCTACETTFPVVDYAIACPGCGSAQTRFAGGDELQLAFLEVEDDSA